MDDLQRRYMNETCALELAQEMTCAARREVVEVARRAVGGRAAMEELEASIRVADAAADAWGRTAVDGAL